MKRTTLILETATVTFLLVRTIAALSVRWTAVPKSFPPFTTLPLLAGVVGGFACASAVYALVRSVSARPDWTFFLIAITFLAFSFVLPLRLSFTKSHRFAGVTPAAQMTLALIHAVVATSAVAVLTRAGR